MDAKFRYLQNKKKDTGSKNKNLKTVTNIRGRACFKQHRKTAVERVFRPIREIRKKRQTKKYRGKPNKTWNRKIAKILLKRNKL